MSQAHLLSPLVNAFKQTVLRKQRSDSSISVHGPSMARHVCMRKTSILLQKSRGCLLPHIYMKITRRVPSENMVQREGIFAAGSPKRTHSGLDGPTQAFRVRRHCIGSPAHSVCPSDLAWALWPGKGGFWLSREGVHLPDTEWPTAGTGGSLTVTGRL